MWLLENSKGAWMNSWGCVQDDGPPHTQPLGFCCHWGKNPDNWKKRHNREVSAIHTEASGSVVLMDEDLCFCSPSSQLFGTGRNVWKRRGVDGWMDERGRGDSLEVVSVNLFGEFADDSDQSSVFIFQTLVVCSQIHQNLRGEKQ